MSLSPPILLGNDSRQRCISKLKEQPTMVFGDVKAKQNASVLVPLCVHNGEVCLLYTLRSLKLKNHSGQVSFPGGMMEANEDYVDTALRETEEEIGVPRESVDVWSVMPQVEGRNDMAITPIVGEITNFDIKKLQKSPDEVEEIFLVPMQAFCDTNNHAHWDLNGIPMPVYIYGQHKIWGITGAITHMFLNSFLPESEFEENYNRKKFDYDELMPAKL